VGAIDNFFTLVNSHIGAGCEILGEVFAPEEEGAVFQVFYFLSVFEEKVVAQVALVDVGSYFQQFGLMGALYSLYSKLHSVYFFLVY
jgi:hypothetical protein